MAVSTHTDFPPAESGNGDFTPSPASEFGQAATIDDKRDAVARGMEAAASTIRDQAERVPGGEKVAGVAHAAADAMEGTADYVRNNDLKAVLSDMRRIVKDHPGATLLTAAALGFLLTRSLTRVR